MPRSSPRPSPVAIAFSGSTVHMASPRLILSFAALVILQTSSNLLFKAAQVNRSYTFNPAGSMVLAELAKLGISLAMVIRTEQGGLLRSRPGVATSTVGRLTNIFRMPLFLLLGYFFLAFAYAANNQLTFVILRVANPGLLSLAKSSTPLLIAVVSAVVFNERLSRLQWQCVVLQVCGMVTCFSQSVGGSGSGGGGDGGDGGGDDDAFSLSAGILIALACALTAGSSALNAHLLHLKMSGTAGASSSSSSSSFSTSSSSSSSSTENHHGEGGFQNIWVQNAVLYSFGAAANLLLFALGITPSADVGFFSGYSDSPMAFLLLLSNALVGLLVTFVYRSGNAVVKTIATSVSSALLLLLPALHGLGSGDGGSGPAAQGPGKAESLQTLTGCVVILTAALIYLENPKPGGGGSGGGGSGSGSGG